MKVKLNTAPTYEPLTLTEVKDHIRLNSGSFADNIDESQSLVPGSHAIADNYTTHVGTGVEVLGYTAIVVLDSGAVGAGGTNDTKIQESDDNATYADWSGGAFNQVAAANDNAIQEKAYTGTKRYIRTASKVLVAACEFGTSVIRLNPLSVDDTMLGEIIKEARKYVEDITWRRMLTQTWEGYLDEFPEDDFIELPFGNLQDVSHIRYKDSSGNESTMSTADYIIEANGEMPGRVVLKTTADWPTTTYYASDPVKVTFICGATTASAVSPNLRAMMKLHIADQYEHRGEGIEGHIFEESPAFQRLLSIEKLWKVV